MPPPHNILFLGLSTEHDQLAFSWNSHTADPTLDIAKHLRRLTYTLAGWDVTRVELHHVLTYLASPAWPYARPPRYLPVTLWHADRQRFGLWTMHHLTELDGPDETSTVDLIGQWQEVILFKFQDMDTPPRLVSKRKWNVHK